MKLTREQLSAGRERLSVLDGPDLLALRDRPTRRSTRSVLVNGDSGRLVGRGRDVAVRRGLRTGGAAGERRRPNGSSSTTAAIRVPRGTARALTTAPGAAAKRNSATATTTRPPSSTADPPAVGMSPPISASRSTPAMSRSIPACVCDCCGTMGRLSTSTGSEVCRSGMPEGPVELHDPRHRQRRRRGREHVPGVRAVARLCCWKGRTCWRSRCIRPLPPAPTSASTWRWTGPA